MIYFWEKNGHIWQQCLVFKYRWLSTGDTTNRLQYLQMLLHHDFYHKGGYSGVGRGMERKVRVSGPMASRSERREFHFFRLSA